MVWAGGGRGLLENPLTKNKQTSDLGYYSAKVTFKIISDCRFLSCQKNFIAFLAELGNLESYETILFFSKKFSHTSNFFQILIYEGIS